jgi:hypothetical protein
LRPPAVAIRLPAIYSKTYHREFTFSQCSGGRFEGFKTSSVFTTRRLGWTVMGNRLTLSWRSGSL